MRNIRGAQKREREWLTREAPQRCAICGKWFVRRADKVCSREYLEKQEQAKQHGRNAGTEIGPFIRCIPSWLAF